MPQIQHKPTILVTVCTGDCYVHKHVGFVTDRLLLDERYRVRVMRPTWRPYEHALNRCVDEVLRGEYSYWLNIDDDNPPTRNPLDLVSHDFDVVGYPTPVYHDAVKGDRPWYFNALDYIPAEEGWKPHEPMQGLQQVDCIGSGCMLIARRVLQRIEPPWFQREYTALGFVERGHDYLFSRRVKQAGFRIFAHFDYPCRHFVELDLLSVVQAFGALFAKQLGQTDA